MENEFLTKRIGNIGILIILFSGLVNAQWRLEPPLHLQLTRGIDLILEQDYRQADSLFNDVIIHYPNHPAGYLYKVAASQAYSIDFDVPVDKQKFDSLLELGKKTAKKIESPWREYFLGTADGYDAYEKVDRGDWFSGVRKGMASASWFEDIIEKDSSFYDAYVGVGTYCYWSSRKTAFIRWLPFIKDYRELGISLLVKGAERSEYNRFAAVSALISIYLDAEEYKKVEDWSKYGLKFYPENRIFLWGLATALDRQKCFKDAVTAYENLLDNILQVNAPNPYGEVVCRLNLVKSRFAINDTTGAAAHIKNILSYKNFSWPDYIQSRAESKFKEAQGLLFEIENRRKTSR
jgi:tetratricopeptide (TPR) repeat protein